VTERKILDFLRYTVVPQGHKDGAKKGQPLSPIYLKGYVTALVDLWQVILAYFKVSQIGIAASCLWRS
jgi:hypothetical protein